MTLLSKLCLVASTFIWRQRLRPAPWLTSSDISVCRSCSNPWWLTDSDPVLQVCQDIKIPIIGSGTPFKYRSRHMNTTHLPYGPLIHRTSLVYRTDQDGWQVWGMCVCVCVCVCVWGTTREEVTSKLVWECWQTRCALSVVRTRLCSSASGVTGKFRAMRICICLGYGEIR
jgi:hypothetical protein